MKNIRDLLEKAPQNWGRWGESDEVGAVNFLGSAEVLRGISTIKEGNIYTLGQPINDPRGDLIGLTRRPPQHHMVSDRGMYAANKKDAVTGSGGVELSDDLIYMYTHSTTHVDSLGHAWYDGKLYNGYDAETTTGGLAKNSIHHVGNKGIVGRSVLLDVARYKGVEWVPEGDEITFEDLINTAAYQNVSLDKRDILLIRTGFYLNYLKNGSHEYFRNGLNEPGITFTNELAHWFYEQQIAVYGTDTLGSEQTHSSQTGTTQPLHPYLITRLGVSILETLWLEDIAAACADDGRYDFCLAISPLKLVGGTASPVNPIAIR
ncbi:cyclase family protein [Peribacillus cavernae]|uniref:Cyclase family protein n=1 Tax=Peribacillus cavernae TaxID=1674310 RepID=A0A433HIF2_9BACI|nr:cyclase family protein [Peribacillus cavernae]MDQ0217691.1 kynurenine formamidase [Peribacillus cavernae]RUQ28161.1 cyclase family protein [Peribacillus cavernae]